MAPAASKSNKPARSFARHYATPAFKPVGATGPASSELVYKSGKGAIRLFANSVALAPPIKLVAMGPPRRFSAPVQRSLCGTGMVSGKRRLDFQVSALDTGP